MLGYQVAPAELEAVLLGHPTSPTPPAQGVFDRDARDPKAYVVPRPAPSSPPRTSWSTSGASPVQKVRAVEFMEAIPKSATGKILRKDLKAMEAARV